MFGRGTLGPCGGCEEGVYGHDTQGCNGSVNPLALRQLGTITNAFSWFTLPPLRSPKHVV